MATIAGIRDLKNKLSHCLKEVRNGRSVIITERGKIVAKIIPAREHPGVEKLKKLTRSGVGTWKGGKPKGPYRAVVVKGKPVGDIVIAERCFFTWGGNRSEE